MLRTEQEAPCMDSHSNPELLDDERQAPEITPPPKLPPATPRKALLLIGLVLLLMVIGGAIAMLMRIHDSHVLANETERESIPTVAVIHPTAEKPDEELVLPGTLQAYEESPIYARTNGYLLRWYKDIGSRVTKGELLADIDTPEVDQELMQVRANRQQIVAQMDLAKINADRYVSLRKTDSVSQQEADQQASGYVQAKANLDAADATVRRLEELESFKHVYAPFSGVLTKRNVDPGALINAGSTGGSAGKELFDIARVDPLRVYVNVPQNYAPAIKNGMEAFVTLSEFPGQNFKGTVVRTAEAIDPLTRTLLTEVDVPNKDGHLLPGSFGEVHFPWASTPRKSRFLSTRCSFARKARAWRLWIATAKSICGRSPLAAITAPLWRSWAALICKTALSSIPPILWRKASR